MRRKSLEQVIKDAEAKRFLSHRHNQRYLRMRRKMEELYDMNLLGCVREMMKEHKEN